MLTHQTRLPVARTRASDPRTTSERIGPGCQIFRNHVGVWQVRFYDRTRSPRRISRTLSTTVKSAATSEAARQYKAWQYGGFDPWQEKAESIAVGEAVKRYLAQSAKEGRKPATMRTNRQRLEYLARTLGNQKDLAAVQEPDARRIYERAGLSPTARYTHAQTNRAFWNWCVREGYLKESPLAAAPRPRKPKATADYLTREQFNHLLAALNTEALEKGHMAPKGAPHYIAWLRPVLLLAASTGLRRRELCGLTWGDVRRHVGPDGQMRTWIEVRGQRTEKGRAFKRERAKWDSERSVPVVGLGLEALAECEARRTSEGEAEPLLKGARGGPISPNSLTHRFKDVAKAARLPERFTFHHLRKTYASWLALDGAPIDRIKDLMGHRDLATTMIYRGLSPDSLYESVSRAFAPANLSVPQVYQKREQI